LIPSARPNNFIRTYSPFDHITIALSDPRINPLFREDLSYRFDSTEKVIGLSYNYENNNVSVEPILGFNAMYDRSGINTWTKALGFKVSGNIGLSYSYYMKVVDNTVGGKIIDLKKELDNTDGFIVGHNNGPDGFDYDDMEGQVGACFGVAQLYIEKIRNVWGYGEDGQILFSRKSPSYPQLRLVLSLNNHLKFTYLHAVLFSDVIDSLQSYGNATYYDTYHRVYRPKYMVAHLIEYAPTDEWNFSLGESMVYSDRFEPVFLIPVLLFKAVEYQSRDNDNAQFFGGMRYSIRSFGYLYTDFFIDDINTNALFSAQNDNILAGTFGVHLTDCIVKNLDVIAEYTRINPWVYTHKNETTTYTSNSYVLGHWLGQNSELFYLSAEYRWIRSLWMKFSMQYIEKGILDPEHIHYSLPGIPSFLEGPLFHQSIIGFETRWEPYRHLFLTGELVLTNQNSDQIALTNLTTDVPTYYPPYSNRLTLNVGIVYNLFENN